MGVEMGVENDLDDHSPSVIIHLPDLVLPSLLRTPASTIFLRRLSTVLIDIPVISEITLAEIPGSFSMHVRIASFFTSVSNTC